MKYQTIESINLEDFKDKARRAQKIATDESYVRYDFNGITCTVSPTTDIDLLARDYDNAFLLSNKHIGPICLESVPVDVEIEMAHTMVVQADKSKVEKVINSIYELMRHIESSPTLLKMVDFQLLNDTINHLYKYSK